MKRMLLAVVLTAPLLSYACDTGVDLDRHGLVQLTSRVYAYIPSGSSMDEGLGANSGFIVGKDGVLVVDSRNTPALARKLLETIRTVTDARILYLVNTHYHPDHTWGNNVFKDEGALIVSTTETRGDLKKYSPAYLSYYKKYKPETYELLKNVQVVLPDTTFKDEWEINLGDVTVVLRHFGPGHTSGDCVVIVPEERIVFTGGLLSNGYHPNLGDQGADFDNWIAILDRFKAMETRYLVPGTGTVCKAGVLDKNKDYIQTLREICREEIKRKTPLEKATFSVTVPGTEGYLQDNLLPFNVQAVYRKEILDVIKPNFTISLPQGFMINDGGGSTGRGWIRWAKDSEEGHLEIEVHWQPTSRSEVISQDIHDRLARYVKEHEGYEMEVEGSKKLDIGGEKAHAAHGTWKYRRESLIRAGGLWTWAIVLRDGTLYTIQLSTIAGYQRPREERNMVQLERIVASFRILSPQRGS